MEVYAVYSGECVSTGIVKLSTRGPAWDLERRVYVLEMKRVCKRCSETAEAASTHPNDSCDSNEPGPPARHNTDILVGVLGSLVLAVCLVVVISDCISQFLDASCWTVFVNEVSHCSEIDGCRSGRCTRNRTDFWSALSEAVYGTDDEHEDHQ